MIALLLKATVLLTLGWVAALLLSRRSAALRHLVWTGVLAAVVMLALASPLLPSLRVSIGPLERAEARLTTVPVVNTISIPAQDQGPAAVTPNPQVTTRISRSPAEYLQLIWLAGGLAVIGWCVLGRLGLAWIRRRAQPLEEPSWQAELDAQRATCNVSRPIRLFLSNRVGSPATWGFIHPVIVLPTEAAGWTPERRSVVLAHELAHIARGDGLANLIGWVASALYWFHPLAWMAAKRLRAEAEKAADDYVLVRGVSPVAYAGHLLVVARGSRLIRLQGANAIGMARPETLEGRLIAVLDSNKNREAPRTLTRRATFGMLAGMVLPLAALTPTRSVEPKLPERPMGIAFPSQDTTRDIDQRFPAKPGGTLTLDFKTGAGVRIEGWDEPALHIGGHLGGRDWRGTLLMIGPDQNGRTIRTRQDREQGNISTSHYFDIKVPRQYNVRIESSGGGVTIVGLEGSFTGSTGGGEITIERARGEARLSTGGGDIRVVDSDLQGTVSTGGGMVLLDRVKGDFRGSSGSGPVVYAENVKGEKGDIRAVTVEENRVRTKGVMVESGPLHIRKAGGDVDLDRAPRGAEVFTGGGAIRIGEASGDVRAQTGGGDIEIGPVDGSVIATTGAGTLTVSVSSAEGSVDLRTGNGAAILELPANFRGRFILETGYTRTHGRTRINSDWSFEQTETDEWDSSMGTPRKFVRAEGQVGSGGGVVRIKITNGDITIRRRR